MRNGEHQEADKLTARLLEVVAPSGRASRGSFVVVGGWREREGAGEVESNQVETKTQNLSYLRMRRVTEKLTGASASLIRHRSSGTTAAVVSFVRRTEKGEKEGCGSAL